MTKGTDTETLRVHLDAMHRELGARMVPFAGYHMPVQYPAGIIAEHCHTRARASLFDVSHMGQAVLRGDNPAADLESLVVGEIQGLAVGRTRYTMMTNDDGGIIDDLMVTNHANHLHLVVNASRKELDFAHIRERLSGRCDLEIRTDRVLLALQGPSAVKVMTRISPPCCHMLFMNTEPLTLAGISCLVTRSGYTGEDGFEISAPVDDAERLCRILLDEPEVRPAGLGARDSLRMEAGLCLYGNEIDKTTTPIEAGLMWAISRRRRSEGGFPGADVILGQIRNGVGRRLVGIVVDDKTPARAHATITDVDGNKIGEVTSGGYGPSVGAPIAMGYVGAEYTKPGTSVRLIVRSRPVPGKVVSLPFVEHRYFKG